MPRVAAAGPPPGPGVQLVFANYHCADAIAQAIAQLADMPQADRVRVVVVENGGPAFQPAIRPATRPGPDVQVLQPGRNSGYFGALRLAHASDRDPAIAWRILCNPDIDFIDREFFVKLAALPAEDRLAVLAPAVQSGLSGCDQNPYLTARPSPLRLARWRLVYSCRAAYVANDLASRWRTRPQPPATSPGSNPDRPPQRIHAPHGSMMIFSSRFLDSCDRLAAIPFLYAEELFVGEICHLEGWTVRYEPSLKVLHREHATTGLLPSRQRYTLQRRAMQAFQQFVVSGGTAAAPTN